MQYLFRDVAHMGKVVRFIKAYDVDSDGFEIGPIDELTKVAKYIKEQEPNTIVAVMTGFGGDMILDWPKNDFTESFDRLHRRAHDEYYNWQSGVI